MRYIWVSGLLSMVIMVTRASSTVASAYKLTTLAEFNPVDGGYGPFTKLAADVNGNLYGTTLFGGPNDLGTVFKLEAGTHKLTTLTTFDYASGQRSDGGLLLDGSGNIYGTTVFGGAFNDGTVFRLDAGSNTITTLATFDGANGRTPYAGLIADADGNLYGTTRLGGPDNKGTVFRLAEGSNELTTLASFDGANGAHPSGGLIAYEAGNLYGTTEDGGYHDHGTVFRLEAGSGAMTTLATFDGANGSAPYSSLIADDDGNLYGTTSYGGVYDSGTVFRVNIDAQSLTTLVTFDVANGLNPFGSLYADADGNMYGTTWAGGATSYGTLYRVAAGTHALTTLVTFGNANGEDPFGGLIADAYGNLYGMTTWGGAYNGGTVFRLSIIPEPGAIILMSLVAIAWVLGPGLERQATQSSRRHSMAVARVPNTNMAVSVKST